MTLQIYPILLTSAFARAQICLTSWPVRVYLRSTGQPIPLCLLTLCFIAPHLRAKKTKYTSVMWEPLKVNFLWLLGSWNSSNPFENGPVLGTTPCPTLSTAKSRQHHACLSVCPFTPVLFGPFIYLFRFATQNKPSAGTPSILPFPPLFHTF